MQIIKEIARYLVGGLFIFSGLIKVNDPVGTQIKLEEYFAVFGGFWEVFIPAALVLSVMLVVVEVVIGIATVIGYRMPITSWILLLMILFFTALTYYSASTGKVTDCGCFGDAIKLTPWESFTKDVILLVLIGVIFIYRRTYTPWFGNKLLMEAKVWGSIVFFLGIALYAIWHLPFIDFRTYKVGNSLPELMQQQGTPLYEYTYTKDGEEFKFETMPTDPTYQYKSFKIVNSEEIKPKISDLILFDHQGQEYTEQLLVGARLLFIFHSSEKAGISNLEDLKTLAKGVKVPVWILTSTGYESFEPFRHKHQLAFPFFQVDATVLKTMIRSNPGIMVLKDGVVMGKWHHNDTPSAYEVGQLAK